MTSLGAEHGNDGALGTWPRVARTVGMALAIAAGAWIAARIYQQAAELPRLDWTPRRLTAMLAAVVIHVVTLVSGAVAWWVLLGALGERLSFGRAWTIFGHTQVAKYLPGNVGHYLGRAALAARAGMAWPRIGASVVFETAWVLLTGVLVAWLTWLMGGLGPQLAARLPRGAILAALVLGAVAAPLVAVVVVRRLSSRLAAREAAETTSPSAGVLAGVAVLDAVTFVLGAVALDVLARGVFDHPTSHFGAVVGIYATAWLVGTLTPGAPGGLGVREALLVAAFEPFYGASLALWLALAHRLTSAGGDLTAFVFTWPAARRLLAGEPSRDLLTG